jgi:DNA repair protein SbcD/Mre11
MSVRMIHAADLHLDSPFEGLDAEKAAVRRSEQRELLGRIVTETKKRKADLLLLAGDLFDSTSAYTETGETLRATLASLDIPVFIAPGNHDRYTRRSPYARIGFPENVHIFTKPQLECIELPSLGVRVWGAGYTDTSCPPLLSGFRVPKEPGIKNILVLHAELGRSGSPYCPVTEQELAQSGFSYAALGHIHTGSGLRRTGRCCYAWPGCPEGRGFDECGEKGILQIDLEDTKCAARFVVTSSRRYEKLEVPAGENALASVRAMLPENTARDIYKITLTGECAAAPDIAYLHWSLDSDFFALTIADETRPPRDLFARAEEDTLAGRFLRRMQQRIDAAPTEEEKQRLLRAVRYGIAALEGWEVRL